jgi:hypothetical protein
MSTIDFFHLPPVVRVLVIVMLWPAIWAGALLIVAFTGDMIRHAGKRTSPAVREELHRQLDAVERESR